MDRKLFVMMISLHHFVRFILIITQFVGCDDFDRVHDQSCYGLPVCPSCHWSSFFAICGNSTLHAFFALTSRYRGNLILRPLAQIIAAAAAAAAPLVLSSIETKEATYLLSKYLIFAAAKCLRSKPVEL